MRYSTFQSIKLSNIVSFSLLLTLIGYLFLSEIFLMFRLEDIVVSLLAPFLYYYLYLNKNHLRYFYHIHFLLLYMLLVTFIKNGFSISVEALLLIAKQWEQLIVFLICFVYYRSGRQVILFNKVVIAAAITALFFVTMDFFNGTVRYYGIGYFSEPTNSAGSGGVFLILSILLYHIYLTSRSKLTLLMSLIFLVFVVLTGSRTSIIMALIIFFAFSGYAKIIFLIIGLYVFSLLFLIDFFTEGIFIKSRLIENVISRVSTLSDLSHTLSVSRIPWWNEMIQLIYKNPIFGGGVGSAHSITQDGLIQLSLNGDSGYLKKITEIGILGSTIYYSLIARFVFEYMGNLTLKQNKIYLYCGIAFLAAEISFEILQSAVVGGLFFLINARALGLKNEIKK